MNTIYVKKERIKERELQKENCLNFLYYVEDIFNYDYEVISNCIDELQNNLQFKEDKRYKNIEKESDK